MTRILPESRQADSRNTLMEIRWRPWLGCPLPHLPLRHLLVLVLAVLSAGASVRTENFIVTADDGVTAREVARAAEVHRHHLAYKWLGGELPAWSDPCPIRVRASADLPVSGQTSFVFVGRIPTDWRMSLQGPRQQILDSVLPHEITHAVFATYFGEALPRWLEEGACVIVEHQSSQTKLRHILLDSLRRGGGLSLEQMFAMQNYPRDVLGFYSQGYSLTLFLIEQGGEHRLVQFIRDGLDTGNWIGTTREHYGYQTLAELQRDWVEWALLTGG